MTKNLGIIAGGGNLPIIISKCAKAKYKNIIVASINKEDQQQDLILTNSANYFSEFKIGSIGSMLDFFKKHNVEDIVIAGNIKKPSFKNIAVDGLGAKLLAIILKNKILGDDSILTIVVNFLEKQGFEVISSQDIIDLNAKSDMQTYTKPAEQDIIDINLGIEVLKSLGRADVGQAVIVENGVVLGTEAIEGTDALIERCGNLRLDKTIGDKQLQSGVLVKMTKPNQNKKVDLPTIGEDTILNLHKAGFKGIAIEANGVIIIDQAKVLEIANKHKIFIHLI